MKRRKLQTRNPSTVFGLGLVGTMAAGLALSTGCRDEAVPEGEEFSSIEMFRSGRSVTLEGEIDGIYETGSFRMDPSFGISNTEILVVRPDRIGASVEEGDEVEVDGVVRTMTIGEFEREVGSDLVEFEEAEQYKVLAAERVQVLEHD